MKLYIFESTIKNDYEYCIYHYPFRIFYNLNGDDKTPNNLEYSSNKYIPDYILNLMKYFENAYNVYIEKYKLMDPLKKGIYYDKGAYFIDILIADIPLQKGLVTAYLIDNSNYFNGKNSMEGESIRIILDKNLIPNTATPIHELFHVFQYNYCNFNNMWFMEGLARWAQNITHTRKNKKEVLPQNMLELNILLDRKHDAEYFWRELIDKCNNRIDFVKVLLEQCVIQENIFSETNDKFEKKSYENNGYIFNAIIDTIKILKISKDTQLEQFLKLINGYKNITIEDDMYFHNMSDKIEIINGDLIIENTDIKSLNGFNRLKKVKTIKIKNNKNLTQIVGLNGLESIQNIEISNNENLEKIYGFFKFFNKIKTIDGYIKIVLNKKLVDVRFLYGLKYVGSLFYLHRNNLNSLCGLELLEEVNDSLSLSGNNISDLTPLSNLKKVDGMLGIAYNNLVSLDGLKNLKEISVVKWGSQYRSFALQGNKNLVDITALDNCISNTNHIIINIDDNLKYIIPPKKLQKDKILFYDTWQYALGKNSWLNPHFSKFKSVNKIIDYSKKHGIYYIYAQKYAGQKFLFYNQKVLKASSLKFIVNDFEVVKILLDKRKFYEHMIESNLDYLIPVYYSKEEEIKYPCVIKETISANGKSVKIVYNSDELETIAPNEVVNEYISGKTEYATNIFYKNGKIIEDITYEKSFNNMYYVLNSDTKYKMINKKVKNKYKKEFTSMINSLLPNGGALTCCIDYKVKDNIPKVFEINVRFGYTLARHEDDFKQMMKVYMKECDNESIS